MKSVVLYPITTWQVEYVSGSKNKVIFQAFFYTKRIKINTNRGHNIRSLKGH